MVEDVTTVSAPVSTTDSPAKGRGRPREFDENEVLDRLLDVFWERGFESASLTEIVEATGLNKSSLYNAFGSKDELFNRVLDRYMDIREMMLTEVVATGGLDSVLAFVELVRAEATGEGGLRGCLAVNASTELGLRSERVTEISDRYRATLRAGLRGPIERAAEAGEIDPSFADAYIEMLLSFVVAVAVASRSGADRAELEQTVDSMRRLVESWRAPERA